MVVGFLDTALGQYALQWGRDLPVADGDSKAPNPITSKPYFNGAATCRSRMGFAGAGWGFIWGNFNGAATCRSRMVESRCRPRRLSCRTSMGPRPAGRGWRNELGRERATNLTSMGPRPAGRGWATLSGYAGRSTMPLQWGRDLPVADGRDVGAVCGDRDDTSMGPRPAGRGWVIRLLAIAGRVHTSMGPRPAGRGWVLVPCRLLCHVDTSMGPRPAGRGWAVMLDANWV